MATSNDAVSSNTKSRGKGSSKAVRYAFYAITVFISVIGWFVLAELYAHGYITQNALNADSSIELSLFFPFIVFSYLLSRGIRLKKIIKDLGLSRNRITVKNILVGVLLFGLILLSEFLVGLFSTTTGIQLPTNVDKVLFGMPLYFLLFTFLIAPIDEEVLFRGFLVPRFGIIPSAMLFALPHLLTYASWSEFAAAFAFGLLAGYFFKRYKSLYTTIFAHSLVNFLTIAYIAFL